MVEFSYPVPQDEPARLEALRSYNVLDTPPEKEFDDLARLAARAAGSAFAAITLVDAERQWYKARVGFDLVSTPREASGFCANAILERGPLVVPDVEQDPRFAGSAASRELGLRFYTGVPLVNCENLVLGTLCVLDREPRQIAPEQVDSLVVIARQVMAQLELRRLATVGEFRERLVSILSDDLRQPLQQVLLAARQGLRPLVSSSPEHRWVEQIALTAERMTRVVRDVLDFTQTRLGAGLSVTPRPSSLAAVCRRVVHEFALSYAGREMHLEIADEGAGLWDEDRIGQAVANLLANALRYGAPNRPVRLVVSAEDGECLISVHNEGNPIPPSVLARLFSPFCREGGPKPGATGSEAPIAGVGLGLFIVREIARACGGTVDARSSGEAGTVFRLHLPREPGAAAVYRPTLRH